jgi:hypothetical protein
MGTNTVEGLCTRDKGFLYDKAAILVVAIKERPHIMRVIQMINNEISGHMC